MCSAGSFNQLYIMVGVFVNCISGFKILIQASRELRSPKSTINYCWFAYDVIKT